MSPDDKANSLSLTDKVKRKANFVKKVSHLKERHLIECFFDKIKHFRRIFSRFDKIPDALLAFPNFVGALICLR